ncbi:unnamed protein product, partial [Ectocarpus sp. 13 AM-2016]
VRLLWRFWWWRCSSGSSTDALPEKKRVTRQSRGEGQHRQKNRHLGCSLFCLSIWVRAISLPMLLTMPLNHRLCLFVHGVMVVVVASWEFSPSHCRKNTAFPFLVDDVERREGWRSTPTFCPLSLRGHEAFLCLRGRGKGGVGCGSGWPVAPLLLQPLPPSFLAAHYPCTRFLHPILSECWDSIHRRGCPG